MGPPTHLLLERQLHLSLVILALQEVDALTLLFHHDRMHRSHESVNLAPSSCSIHDQHDTPASP